MKIGNGVVTETWLSDGEGLEDDIEDLMLGAGMGLHCLNRPANAAGVSHGGVAVLFRDSEVSLKPIKVHNLVQFW